MGNEGEEIRAALQKARKWNAWELQWASRGAVEVPAVVDWSAAKDVFAAELQGFFQDFAVAWARVGEKGDRVAFRLSIAERASARSVQRRTVTVYLLYFLRSDLVLASATKVRCCTVSHLDHSHSRATRSTRALPCHAHAFRG